MNNARPGKLKFSTKIAYAIGQVTDSMGYNVFYFFFLFFLTDFVGIPPGKAGTISLFAILWDAVTDPIIGQFSDNLKSKYGRRRPLMLIGTIPYALLMFLMFHNINASAAISYYYYLLITILFWSSYKIFVIPFFSLGAELTDDFTERTSLRSWASIFLYLAVMISSSLPPTILDKVVASGRTGSNGWSFIGLLFGSIILVTGLISWNFTRGSEKKITPSTSNTEAKAGLLRSMKEIILLKPSFFLALSVFVWSAITSILSGGVIYLMTTNLNYSAARQTSYFLFLSVLSMAFIPVINFLSKKIDKKIIYASAMLISTISLFGFTFIGFPTYNHLLIYTVFYCYGNSVFWTVYYSMMYDISELDEFVHGSRREGAISALMSFSQKIGAAIATWSIGFMLSLANYQAGATAQTTTVYKTILYINTLIPAILGVIAVTAAFSYPLTKKRFESLMVALLAKRENEEYTTDEFNKILSK